ncbi:MAG TPA: hypothetical protein VF541_20440 [Longimicrobium sp.]|jgi:hypothetical protein
MSGGPGPREERGTAESSSRHPPHVDVNAQGQPAQQSSQSPTDVPTMPANAHGSDVAPAGEQPHTIDEGSMYDRRPEEDKDRRAGT